MDVDSSSGGSCPIGIGSADTVRLAHGSGGKPMARLIEELFLPAFGEDAACGHDGAVLEIPPGKLAFTTDSYVVRPLFFPGADIGALAVNGTVNDLAMCGARPLYLSAGFILEEGLAMETLARVAASMRSAAAAARVRLVTGDTKVVERGKGDGVFINTAGVGCVAAGASIHPRRVRPGDSILLSGDIARHGMAVMAAREDLGFESALDSDCAPLATPVLALLEAGIDVHCLRDPTRGGLASALVEIAETARARLSVDERAVVVRDDVRAACELLGLDPLYVANEGRFVAFVAKEDAERALEVLSAHRPLVEPVIIGEVEPGPGPRVVLRTSIGGSRLIDRLSDDQLPRIC